MCMITVSQVNECVRLKTGLNCFTPITLFHTHKESRPPACPSDRVIRAGTNSLGQERAVWYGRADFSVLLPRFRMCPVRNSRLVGTGGLFCPISYGFECVRLTTGLTLYHLPTFKLSHFCTFIPKHTNSPIYQFTNLHFFTPSHPIPPYSHTQIYQSTNSPIYISSHLHTQYPHTHTHKYTNIPIHQFTNSRIH